MPHYHYHNVPAVRLQANILCTKELSLPFLDLFSLIITTCCSFLHWSQIKIQAGAFHRGYSLSRMQRKLNPPWDNCSGYFGDNDIKYVTLGIMQCSQSSTLPGITLQVVQMMLMVTITSHVMQIIRNNAWLNMTKV